MRPYDCTIKPVSDDRYGLGEGPYYDENTQKLYMVDAFVGDFICHDLKNKTSEKRHFDDVVTFIIPHAADGNKFVVSKNKSICELDWAQGTLKELAQVEPGASTRFNDAKCDPRGRLWAGTMGLEISPAVVEPEQGSLYSFDGKQVRHHVDKVSLSNGLTWSNDRKTMYYVDSVKRLLYGFDYDDASGTLNNQRVIFDFNKDETAAKDEVPDGMSIDSNGNIWLACFQGSRIVHIDPRTSKIIGYIAMPALKVTSLCFAGKDKLYATSATFKLTDEQRKQQPLAGALFEITLNLNIEGAKSQPFVPTA